MGKSGGHKAPIARTGGAVGGRDGAVEPDHYIASIEVQPFAGCDDRGDDSVVAEQPVFGVPYKGDIVPVVGGRPEVSDDSDEGGIDGDLEGNRRSDGVGDPLGARVPNDSFKSKQQEWAKLLERRGGPGVSTRTGWGAIEVDRGTSGEGMDDEVRKQKRGGRRDRRRRLTRHVSPVGRRRGEDGEGGDREGRNRDSE